MKELLADFIEFKAIWSDESGYYYGICPYCLEKTKWKLIIEDSQKIIIFHQYSQAPISGYAVFSICSDCDKKGLVYNQSPYPKEILIKKL